jgi:hypothetical protein
MRARAPWFVVGVVAIAGCSRQETVSCVPDPRYGTARSAQPVQIPDDLSPPNESDALRLPPPVAIPVSAGECLQTPPSFFGESRPFQVNIEPSRRERREARRQERREESSESSEAPADRAEPAAAEPADAPSDQDRVIDN